MEHAEEDETQQGLLPPWPVEPRRSVTILPNTCMHLQLVLPSNIALLDRSVGADTFDILTAGSVVAAEGEKPKANNTRYELMVKMIATPFEVNVGVWALCFNRYVLLLLRAGHNDLALAMLAHGVIVQHIAHLGFVGVPRNPEGGTFLEYDLLMRARFTQHVKCDMRWPLALNALSKLDTNILQQAAARATSNLVTALLRVPADGAAKRAPPTERQGKGQGKQIDPSRPRVRAASELACFDWQTAKCTRGKECRYKHVCSKCSKAGHVAAQCVGQGEAAAAPIAPASG